MEKDTFKITKTNEKIPDIQLKILLSAALKYTPVIFDSKNFILGDINSDNSKIAHKKIFELFKNFADECHSTLSRKYRRQEINYLSSYGFPVCVLPNGNEIITIGPRVTPNGECSLHFLWLGQEV